MVIIITITMTTFIFFETRALLAVFMNGRKGSRQTCSLPGHLHNCSLSMRLSPLFAFSGSNLVVLIIKASAGCCCRVNQEVKCTL